MKKSSAQNSAFTLVEVIIGVAILSIVMASITVLTIVSIQANQANVDRLTGYYLAQEGLEGLRNLRDTNWLKNYGWDKAAAGGAAFDNGFYKIDYLPTSDPPWELTKFSDEAAALSGSSLKRVSISGKVYYVHEVDTSWTELDSKFNRYIIIAVEDLDGDSVNDELEATARVFWTDHGREVEVEVSTKLTDWREGPI